MPLSSLAASQQCLKHYSQHFLAIAVALTVAINRAAVTIKTWLISKCAPTSSQARRTQRFTLRMLNKQIRMEKIDHGSERKSKRTTDPNSGTQLQLLYSFCYLI